MLTDDDGTLAGLFTDSDLARLFEKRRDEAMDRPIAEVMTPSPITISQGARLMDAVEILRKRKISELPVVDAKHRPVGADRYHRPHRLFDAGGSGEHLPRGVMTTLGDLMDLAERCRPIELLLMDVDGVLTDGRIIYTERGDEIKEFHVPTDRS
ncbi:MAG: CBS domain-containing protein [Gemmataceae bacterium]